MFSLMCLWKTFILFSVPVFAWEIGDSQWDKRKLRNNYTYIVEGKAAMGVILDEKEAIIFKILGQPTRRSFGTLDELYFERHSFHGSIYLYKGNISRFRYYITHNQSESLKWTTALGLTQQMVENLDEARAKKLILEFYKNPRYLEKPGSLLIFTMGIQFKWSNDKLASIEVFKPWSN